MNKVSIYVLIDPFTKEIKYVGKTICDPKKRLAGHIDEARQKEGEKSKWIKKLLSKKATPIIKVIDQVNESEWEDWEKYYIKSYREAGINLFNISEGGLVHPKMLDLRNTKEKRKSSIGLGKQIKRIRLEMNKTQRKLAKEVGISTTHMCLIETDVGNPSLSILYKICDNLNSELRILPKL